MKDTRDRIEKGVDLAKAGHVQLTGSGNFRVKSETRDMTFTVDIAGRCHCEDYRRTNDICKHQWATIGYQLALHLLDFRTARTFEELDTCLDRAQPVAALLIRKFKLAMRHEYGRNFHRVEEEEAKAKMSARELARAAISARPSPSYPRTRQVEL